MKNLKKKLKKQEGFTLIEMLIVVAIIAILIAISIPLVGQALERAREATDAANERSFKAELIIAYLSGEVAVTTDTANPKTYYYNAATGKVQDSAPATGYGKGTTATGVDKQDRTGDYLKGYVTADGDVSIEWNNSSGLTSTELMK